MATHTPARRFAWRCSILFAGVFHSQVAWAAHVVLTNNDRLTGTVAAVSKSELSLNSELAGHVTVKWSAISALTGAGSVRVTLSDGQAVEGVPVVAGGQLSVQHGDGTAVRIDPDTTRAITIATSSRAVVWGGSLNAGLNMSRGNAETETLSMNGTATRTGHADHLGMFGTFLFSSIGSGASAATTARASRGGMRYDHDVLGRLFGFGFGELENDPLQLLNLRTVVGGGAGAHIVKTDTTRFDLFGGISFANDSYAAPAPSTTTTPMALSVTNPTGKVVPGLSHGGTPPAVVRTSLSRKVGEFVMGQGMTHQLSDDVYLTENLAFYPAVGNAQDYRLSFDLSVSAQINGWLQWNANVADRYLNIPPAGGAVQNDRFVSTGLGITWGRGADGAYTGSDTRPPEPPTQ